MLLEYARLALYAGQAKMCTKKSSKRMKMDTHLARANKIYIEYYFQKMKNLNMFGYPENASMWNGFFFRVFYVKRNSFGFPLIFTCFEFQAFSKSLFCQAHSSCSVNSRCRLCAHFTQSVPVPYQTLTDFSIRE